MSLICNPDMRHKEYTMSANRTLPGTVTTLTTSQAAERLGITPDRVRKLIVAGSLKAERLGPSPKGGYMIDAADLEAFAKNRRGPGRKPKEEPAYVRPKVNEAAMNALASAARAGNFGKALDAIIARISERFGAKEQVIKTFPNGIRRVALIDRDGLLIAEYYA